MDTGGVSLKKLIIKASSWALFGYGSSQILRFIGNIIVTRFLPPADFGIMQLVLTLTQGMVMFSDIGSNTNIIQHKRGDDPSFIRSAWTLNILRGLLLWFISCLFAWPFAKIYDSPEMLWLIPVSGFTLFLNGCISSNLAVLNRHLKLNLISIIDLTSTFCGVAAMIFAAWYWRSIWALIVPGIVSTSMQIFLSHLPIMGVPMKLQLEKEAIRDLLHFGKWIFFSSILTFFNSRLDRLILGLYMTKTELGLYGIAAGITLTVLDIVQVLAGRIFIPVYAHLRDFPLEKMRSRIKKMRFGTECLCIPIFVCLVIFGQEVINFIYPASYSNAGWMLRLLSAGAIVRSITLTITPIFLAMGNSFKHMVVQLIQCLLLISFILIGNYYGGVPGMIIGVALTDIVVYPFMAWLIKPYKVWMPGFDFLSAAIPFLLIFLGLTIKGKLI